MRHYNPQKTQRYKIFFVIAIALSITAYIVFSPNYERENPDAVLISEPFWNLITPLEIELSDNVALKSYRVSIRYNDQEALLEAGNLSGEKSVKIAVKNTATKNPPTDQATLVIEVADDSNWHFFDGNRIVKTVALTIDRVKPVVTVVANSYGIAMGGSALVVFEARDENLREVVVVTKNGRTFTAAPFFVDGFYAALVAREIDEKEFQAYAYASDHAGNQMRARIPFYLKDPKYRSSTIKLTKSSMEGKIDDLNFMHNHDKNASELTQFEKFIFVNETLRKRSLEMIAEATKPAKLEFIDRFEVAPFIPLPNSSPVAGFGDKRDYTLDGIKVSSSTHYGLDLASIKEAAVRTSNGGGVIFSGENGIYGNMPIVHHGLGLYSLYGHCTKLTVAQGETASAGSQVGTTGVSGLAFGDHTHFETRVQGVAVTPIEWMDERWIKANIVKVQEDAKTIINGRDR
ncbi:peptidase M23 [Campylobacterota bacterium]|nr:peptidase M23 [Campylobacterota bacterium]